MNTINNYHHQSGYLKGIDKKYEVCYKSIIIRKRKHSLAHHLIQISSVGIFFCFCIKKLNSTENNTMRTFNQVMKIIAVVTLLFFSWTYLPVYAVVAYAAESKQSAERKGQSVAADGSRGLQPAQAQRPEERFEKALEDIREKIGKAEEKAGRGDAVTEEIESTKAKKAEIETLDIELTKEFAATEKKLKDAKLPKEILDRHYKFVKHYENNLKELAANLDSIENVKADKGKLKAALAKTKAHLDKTKPPSKHVPLDPNNLPFQNRKAKAAKAPTIEKRGIRKGVWDTEAAKFGRR